MAKSDPQFKTSWNLKSGYLMVKLPPKEEKVSILHVPEAYQKRSLNEGQIVATSKDGIPERFKVGTTVFFAHNTEFRIEEDGNLLSLVHENDVIMWKP